jgi:hypothetical protein
VSVLKRSAVDAIAGGFDHGPVRPLACVYCFARIDGMTLHPVTTALVAMCGGCIGDDVEDYAGITKEEARADDAREGFDANGALTIDLDDYEPED